MTARNALIFFLRRDLRVSDNPIFHHLATKDHGFTDVLPIFVFPPKQVEISGFLQAGKESPYPPAKSEVGGFWRCGPHRARFLSEAVWDLKSNLEALGSGLMVRVGEPSDVLQHIVAHLKDQSLKVGGVWMTEEKSSEEKQEQSSIASVCSDHGIEFKLFNDEKYYVDDRDTGLKKASELPDVFTSYRKSQEPLRERPRPALPRPTKSTLPPLPDSKSLPSQEAPFVEAESFEDLQHRLLSPLGDILPNAPSFPENAVSAHPFKGGESSAWERLTYLIKSGGMTAYKDTRNGLIGPDFSTKLSAFLALGCISARQIHQELLAFEDGTNPTYEPGQGYGNGENEGTRSVRFELLWRDYMRLCSQKFGSKLFRLSGFRHDQSYDKVWKTSNTAIARHDQKPSPAEIRKIIDRFVEGSTGMGLIDASQRELFHTGYTSNRARQNVASFFAKHLGIDWRYGAEWYEMLLVDYDVSSNWSNWQYVAGVGNDPRGDARIFNPVKQAFDYDKEGTYVRTWVPEVKGLEKLENVFQPCTASQTDLDKCGIADHIMVTDPIKRIEFMVDRKPKTPRKPFSRRHGHGRGGRRGGGGGGVGGAPNGSDGYVPDGLNSAKSGSDNKENSGHHSNGHYNSAGRSHGQQYPPLGMQPSYKDMMAPLMSYGAPMYAPPPVAAYPQPQPMIDAQWYTSWNPVGRDYGNGYRGRGARRGNPGFGGRGGFGRSPYMTYPNVPSSEYSEYFYPPQHMGPTV